MAKDSGLPAEKAMEQAEQRQNATPAGSVWGAFGAEAKQSFNKRSLTLALCWLL